MNIPDNNKKKNEVGITKGISRRIYQRVNKK